MNRIYVSEGFPRLRLMAAVFFALVGAGALTYGFMSFIGQSDGWTEIEVSADEASCGDDFTFRYNLGAGEASATVEYKALTQLYSAAAVKAHQLFHNEQTYDGVYNVRYINEHPNEVITVDEVLYEAFETLEEAGSRYLYYAPVYADYRNLYACTDDSQTYEYDAAQNDEEAAYFAEIAAYAADSSMIDLELLGENQVRLYVSEEYLAYAQEIGFESYIDFFMLKNAFVIDYLADTLSEAGYTNGYLASGEGMVRNLDTSGAQYEYQIYRRDGNTVSQGETLTYTAPAAIVCLRDYMLTDSDAQSYYEFADGTVYTPYLNETTCLPTAAVSTLTAYCEGDADAGCADILLDILPVYTQETLDEAAVEALEETVVW